MDESGDLTARHVGFDSLTPTDFSAEIDCSRKLQAELMGNTRHLLRVYTSSRDDDFLPASILH
jgi:hypothetical protein